jgi:hypothetical protein
MNPRILWNFQSFPWERSGYFLELHNNILGFHNFLEHEAIHEDGKYCCPTVKLNASLLDRIAAILFNKLDKFSVIAIHTYGQIYSFGKFSLM